MDELFSCRNCVHNCGQSLSIGNGPGFCVMHDSVLKQPERTTCKYLFRKDLPRFVVDEGISEHAGEFAGFSALADLFDRTPVPKIKYSERFLWEHRQFDPVNQSLAAYHRTEPAWIFLQAMSGGIDGRRALAHASLVRRYMDNCGTWRSSYRFVLALVQEMATVPQFPAEDLVVGDSADIKQEAAWDVFFVRLSGVQEYGFHSGLERLMWASDQLNGSLATLDWPTLANELKDKSGEWTELIIDHAVGEGEFFPPPIVSAP